jgi:hypothetical protein
MTTATAAKAALEAATLAEASATKTAEAARQVMETTRADMADATGESSLADASELLARDAYQSAVDRARDRDDGEDRLRR